MKIVKENIYFYTTVVRHGETFENKTLTIQGHMDTILSPVGIQQAKDLGESLSHLCVDLIVSSDLKRAHQTAEQIQAKLIPKPPLQDFYLMRERNFGTNNGKPRTLIHEFIAQTKKRHDGCKLWRDCGGECGHQVFWRALDFFFNLCEMAKKRAGQEEPVIVFHEESEQQPLPLFLPIQHPPVPLAFLPPLDADNSITENEAPGLKYGGHFILVGHGQWIREFISILATYSLCTLGFPSTREMVPVLSNCQFCQFGISFDPTRLASYARLLRETVTSSLYSARDRNLRPFACGYNLQTEEYMPVHTVCYHIRLGSDTVHRGRLTVDQEEVEKKEKKIEADASTVPLTAGTGVETLYFVDDDDEYAGMPMEDN